MCIYYIFAPYYCPSHNAYILLFCLFQGYRYHKLKQAKVPVSFLHIWLSLIMVVVFKHVPDVYFLFCIELLYGIYSSRVWKKIMWRRKEAALHSTPRRTEILLFLNSGYKQFVTIITGFVRMGDLQIKNLYLLQRLLIDGRTNVHL